MAIAKRLLQSGETATDIKVRDINRNGELGNVAQKLMTALLVAIMLCWPH